MDFVIALIGALAVLVAGLALLCVIVADDARAAPRQLDDAALTEDDVLYAGVDILPFRSFTQRVDALMRQQPNDMQTLSSAADAFARAQSDPGYLRYLLEADTQMNREYAYGVAIVHSALSREMMRRWGAQ